MSTDKISYFKYVPRGFAHVWERAGWRALPHVLSGTGHGDYCIYMQWAREGEPICPRNEEAA